MTSRPYILITRPLPEAENLAAEIKKMGGDFFIEPMLEILPLEFEIPALSKFQGMVVTSPNAARQFVQKNKLISLPVYAVGDTTAAAMRDLCFQNVISAAGDADDLIALIRAQADPDGGKLLYVRGANVSRTLDKELSEYGFKVESVVAYESRLVQAISKDLQVLMKARHIDTVSFFSKRTADNFLRLVTKNGLENHLKSMKVLCLSQSVLECVRPDLWAEAYTAQTPDMAGMLSLINRGLRG